MWASQCPQGPTFALLKALGFFVSPLPSGGLLGKLAEAPRASGLPTPQPTPEAGSYRLSATCRAGAVPEAGRHLTL